MHHAEVNPGGEGGGMSRLAFAPLRFIPKPCKMERCPKLYNKMVNIQWHHSTGCTCNYL